MPDATAILHNLLEFLRLQPILLFFALAILPGLGMPSSVLLITAGMAWGTGPKGCIAALVAIAINLAWTHWVGAGPGQKPAKWLLGRRWEKWAAIGKKNPLRLTAMVRITPGFPLMLQNYMLGLLQVPFLPYMAISVPLNGIFVVGFVITGGALLEGKTGMIIAGASIILVALIGIKFLQKHLARQP